MVNYVGGDQIEDEDDELNVEVSYVELDEIEDESE
jgi:hypothetical protein